MNKWLDTLKIDCLFSIVNTLHFSYVFILRNSKHCTSLYKVSCNLFLIGLDKGCECFSKRIVFNNLIQEFFLWETLTLFVRSNKRKLQETVEITPALYFYQ